MSQISSIYDAMHSRIVGVLTDHKRLPNPYKPIENTQLFLKKGYGVAILEGNNDNNQLSSQLGITRDFRVVITRKMYALENQGTDKATTEKNLLEDQFLVIKDFEKNTTLNSTASMTEYVSDSGIQTVSQDKDNYLSIETVFRVQYFENLL